MKIYSGEVLVVCRHPDKYCDHKQCDNEDIKFLICHVTSREHLFKRLREFMREPLRVSHHLAMFSSHRFGVSRKIDYLICSMKP